MNNYPPGMTMRDFDRAYHDEEENCIHGNWTPECVECLAEYEADAADMAWQQRDDQD